MLRNGEGHQVAATTFGGDNSLQKNTGGIVCRQRSCNQVNQDTNLPPSEPTYRTPTPLYQGIGGPEVGYNERDNWEGEPSMPTNQTPADGQTNGMDEEVMFEKLFNEWINEILFWGACKVIGLQGLQNRRVYGWRSPLGDNSKDVLE